MVYVDDSLCTGCGICVEACNRGAISLQGNAAVIDETLCTSCGRCVDVCPTGAIISVEPVETAQGVSDVSPGTRVETGHPQQTWTQTSPRPTGAVARTAETDSPPDAAKTSRLDLVEKALSGLFAIATYVLDRKKSGPWDPAGPDAGVDRLPSQSRGRQSPGCRQGPRGGGIGRGQGPGGGRGMGRGQGKNAGCRGNQGSRTT